MKGGLQSPPTMPPVVSPSPRRSQTEVPVTQNTARTLEHAAARIERAYLARRPSSPQGFVDGRVWSAAASVLAEAHRIDSRVPVDPELFVASLVEPGTGTDPWTELTGPSARSRYLSRVRAMIRGLRREIREEIRRGEASLDRGESPEVVLMTPSRSRTSLARYLTAVRIGRLDLADRLRNEAAAQHSACPLYRPATLGLIPEDAYPVSSLLPGLVPVAPRRPFSLN